MDNKTSSKNVISFSTIELDYICLLQQQRIKYIIFKDDDDDDDDDDDEEVDEGINNKNKNNIHSEKQNVRIKNYWYNTVRLKTFER